MLAGFVLGSLAGCASDDFMPLPPAGRLDDQGRNGTVAEPPAPSSREETAARKAAAKPPPPEAVRSAAEAEKTPAADKKRPRQAEKTPAPEARRAAAAYVLQVGDEIDIQVYREPELSGAFKIGPAGEIRHSLAGAIPLAGKTVAEAEAFFTRTLDRDYLVNPRVIVKLLTTQSSQIVLMGEVEKPGVYPLPYGETMTLLQAIAGAGGFTELASPDRVRIVRRLPDGRQTTLKFRVSDLLGGKGKQQDVPLEPNDIVMVPEVLF
ncbi:MAG: polysaccharide biosynthesis/export family protein [Kiritimatiellia bacterium]